MNVNKDVCKAVRWRSPDRWDKFKEPMDNLMYAVLIRAAADVSGYKDCNGAHGRRYDGNEALEFLENDGKMIYEYLTNKAHKLTPSENQKHYSNKQRNKKCEYVCGQFDDECSLENCICPSKGYKPCKIGG